MPPASTQASISRFDERRAAAICSWVTEAARTVSHGSAGLAWRIGG
jgi:hypothetical protein